MLQTNTTLAVNTKDEFETSQTGSKKNDNADRPK